MSRYRLCILSCLLNLAAWVSVAQSAPSQSSSSSSSSKHSAKAAPADSGLETGSVSNGLYRNKSLGFTCKIPDGWVLRTEEMNAGEDERNKSGEEDREARGRTAEGGCPHNCSKVLLAAFSRPPEAKGEEVNSSILIAAESADAYPGLKDALQYFEPLTEVAKAQGFLVDEAPYEFAVGSKTLVRSDFHKDVGTRVMRQSTLAMLSLGYAVSFTVIGGSEDEVEELIDRLEFQPAPRSHPAQRGPGQLPK